MTVVNNESVVDDEAFMSGPPSSTNSSTVNHGGPTSAPVYASVQSNPTLSHAIAEQATQTHTLLPPVPPLLPLSMPPSLLPLNFPPPPPLPPQLPPQLPAPTGVSTTLPASVVNLQPGVFRPKVLNTRELSHAVEQILRENIKLGEDDKRLMARMYDTFRTQVAAALVSQDHAIDKFFWVELLGDMMVMAATFKTSGLSKKEIIMETLRIIVKFEVPPEREEQSIQLIETILSPAIDLTIYFKNQIFSGKKFAWCFCFQ